MSAPPTISIWVPVISVIVGASIGFLASFGTAYFNHRRKSEDEKNTRQRNRLEQLYKALIAIKNENFHLQTEIIQKIHFNKPFDEFKKSEDLHPNIELEMIVSLYFPELKDSHNRLKKAKDNFGKLLGKAMMDDFSSYTTKQKQEFCGDVVIKDGVVGELVKEMQLNIANIIKT